MSEVDINIHGRTYRIACGEGEEERLRRIAQDFDARVKNLHHNMGKKAEKLSEAHLMLLTALLMEDELEEMREKSEKPAENKGDAAAPHGTEFEHRVTQVLDEVLIRLEKLAARLDQG